MCVLTDTHREPLAPASRRYLTADARTREATALAGQIASAVTEQKAASEDIARRLESIAQSAEENSALTGNNRDIAQGLRRCAADLQTQIGGFRVS